MQWIWSNQDSEFPKNKSPLIYQYRPSRNDPGKNGRSASSISVNLVEFQDGREILFALATNNRDMGRTTKAMNWAEKLVALNPADPFAQHLLQSLGIGDCDQANCVTRQHSFQGGQPGTFS